jgi:purine-binding chemotaxis protein CheW
MQATDKKQDQGGRYLSFSLGANLYAAPLLGVKEVIALPEIKALPQAPSYFLGVINLRGQIITVIDLQRKLGIPEDLRNESCVIICDLHPHSVGLLVTAVNQVLNLTSAQIGPRPEGPSVQKQGYITGITKLDDKLVILIDIAACLELADHALIGSHRPAA